MTLQKLGAATAIALLALGGCDRVGSPLEVLAVKRPAPDEFQVIAREPLRMPASASLPEPRPGTPSPLDPDPGRDAAIALLGTPARPVVGGTAGSGEQALLAAADAAASDPEIRTILAAERETRSGEYEPPSIWELFGASSKPEAPPEEIIDAAAEARRLQTEGVAAAPIDPNDLPEGEEPEPAASPYPVTIDRRPQNKLPSSEAAPAF